MKAFLKKYEKIIFTLLGISITILPGLSVSMCELAENVKTDPGQAEKITTTLMKAPANSLFKNIVPLKESKVQSLKDLSIETSADNIAVWSNIKNFQTPFFPEGRPGISQDGKFYWMHFDKGKAIEFKNILASDLNINSNFLLTIVFKLAKSNRNGDLFGWGDCLEDRFLIHAPMQAERIQFMLGTPAANQLRLPLPKEEIIVLSIFRNNEVAYLIANHELNVFNGSWKKVKVTESSFFLGISRCENQFLGEISELWMSKKLSDKKELFQLHKYFLNKYGAVNE